MPSKPKEEVPANFKKGDKVIAKRSGSNAYYDAVVEETTSKVCKVSFGDGSIRSVKPSDIKMAAEARSPPRSRTIRTRSRSRSAGRRVAAARSRSRSPARKSSSKSEKKIPSKVVKNSNSHSEGKLVEEMKTSFIKEISESTTVTEKSGDKNTVTSSKDLFLNEFDTDKSFLNLSGLRTSARIAALQIARSTVQTAGAPSALNTLSKEKSYSDDESEDEIQELPKEKENSGRFWILSSLRLLIQTLFMPVLAILLFLACTKRQCTVMAIPRFPQRWTTFFDYKAGIVYVSFLFLQAVLLLLPIGKEVNGFSFGEKDTVFKYRLNGFYSAVISISLMGVLAYFDVPLNFGCDKFFSLMIASIVFSTLLSIALFVKSKKAPPHLLSERANAGFLSSFRDGRELNPRFGRKFDLKVYVCRVSLISWMLLDLCFLYKSYYVKGYISTSLVLTVSMQMFYLLDFFWHEEKLLSSAAFTTDGMGYEMVMGSCTMISFTYNLQALYLVNYGTKANTLPYWCCAAIVALFFCGYFIYRKSTNIKHAFRKNPYSPALSHVESVPTSKKRRLIVSGWWGIVRHPNYLGDLIMFIAWTLPCGFNHFIPLFPMLNTLFLLMLRSVVIESDCKRRYGPAWQTYTEKVRSRMFPYVF